MNKFNLFFHYALETMKILVALIYVAVLGYVTYFFYTYIELGFWLSLVLAFIVSSPVVFICSILSDILNNISANDTYNNNATNVALGYVAHQQQVNNHRNL
ncbi:MAG: hypothetical protein SOX56_02495 [[Pasteurella] mairii]|nr:hypothetical protein [[Pasteurella] mairii]